MKNTLGPVAVFVVVLAAFPVAFVISPHAALVASETTKTLEMIAPYRSWGKANKQPIVVPLDRAAISG